MTTQTIVKSFRWKTHNKQELLVQEMSTQHIVYSLRMLWNHLAPDSLRIPGGKRWRGIDRMPADYLKESVRQFLLEAAQRNDLTVEHTSILQAIQKHLAAKALLK